MSNLVGFVAYETIGVGIINPLVGLPPYCLGLEKERLLEDALRDNAEAMGLRRKLMQQLSNFLYSRAR